MTSDHFSDLQCSLIGESSRDPKILPKRTHPFIANFSSGPPEMHAVRVRVFFFFSNDVPALKNERKWEKACIPGHRRP